ncbi:MAG: hypothetical protein P8H53_01640, partial [Paracoccaceae bacterium]|nr:hypothetical protein [Paracoccaceae bacterium]
MIISDLELGGTLDGRDELSSCTLSSPKAIKVLMSGRHLVEDSEGYFFVSKPWKMEILALLFN